MLVNITSCISHTGMAMNCVLSSISFKFIVTWTMHISETWTQKFQNQFLTSSVRNTAIYIDSFTLTAEKYSVNEKLAHRNWVLLRIHDSYIGLILNMRALYKSWLLEKTRALYIRKILFQFKSFSRVKYSHDLFHVIKLWGFAFNHIQCSWTVPSYICLWTLHYLVCNVVCQLK